ncbi:hypothetical protein HZH66_013409 [Vespula vulgaris]|uniref:Uncharacterized protein n=2 Tax=Vespula vulgaris TaxID=7454 RepID=A0A834MQU8_VESVU|nr:hypothetical protein HZH66_013409 [Vespula vulgaris]
MNSWGSDLAKRCSWAKKRLDVLVPLGMIRGRYWEIDAMEEIIKYTTKCLLNDGLLGCFVNSIVLNNRLIKICRELDALGFDSNVLSNFNLSREDCEKDRV